MPVMPKSLEGEEGIDEEGISPSLKKLPLAMVSFARVLTSASSSS